MTTISLTQEHERVIMKVRKVGTNHIAKELGITRGSLNMSIRNALKSKKITDKFVFRLKQALERFKDILTDFSDYNDGNNPDMLPFLEGLFKKYSGKKLPLDRYDNHVRDFLDLTEKYGAAKGIRMAILLLQE